MSALSNDPDRSEREAFEAWCFDTFTRPIQKHVGGRYVYPSECHMWKAWQARAAVQAAQPEAVGWKLVPIEPTPAMLVAMWDHRESMRGQSENRIARAGYAAMLASAPTTEPMSAPTAEPVAWLPISTAPKDGTVVLLCRDDRVTAGHWEPERWPTAVEHHSTTGEYLGQFETGECVEAWWYSEDGGFCEETPPTHWMPLPAPHKEQK